MLNTDIKLGSNSQTVKFNNPSSGMMQKSHPKSKIIRFAKGSEMETMIFSCDEKKPYINTYKYNDRKYEEYKESNGRVNVEVLQLIIFGDIQYMVEVVEPKFLIET